LIYVFASVKNEEDKMNRGTDIPGLFTDYFFESSDPHVFDRYKYNTSVFYPYDGGKFFETHEDYEAWLKRMGKEPYPKGYCFPVRFMPINKEGVPEYTIPWIAKNFNDFTADWVNFEFRYKDKPSLDKRAAWATNAAIEGSVSVRDELLSLRKIVSILLNDYINRNNQAAAMSLDEDDAEPPISEEDSSSIEEFLTQTEQVNAAVEAVKERVRAIENED
jgi:hypothetical protein